MKKLIDIAIKVKKAMFKETNFTKSNISFLKGNQYSILCLKQSKINIKHIKMQIILIAISKNICLVIVLKKLFIQNLCLANTVLF